MANNILLSILVPTVPNRIDYFYPRIMKQLLDQTKKYSNIEIIAFFDNKKRTIGKKRDEMLKLAQGKYVTFVDDDDRLSNDYIDEIINAINRNENVDCIVYNTETNIETTNKKVLCMYGTEFTKTGYINKEHTQWRGKPAHTMVWKSSIAKNHPFLDMNNGEDYNWVNRAYLDIKTQHRIDKILYYYDACYTTTSETANLPNDTIIRNMNKYINMNKSLDHNINMTDHWEKCHSLVEPEHHFFLTGSTLNQYLLLFKCNNHYIKSNNILEIGIGEGHVVKEMFNDGKNITTCDISESAKNKIKNLASYYHLNNIANIPKNNFDIIFCHLVVQHINDSMLEYHLKHFIPTLNEKGVYYIQYRGKHDITIDKNMDELCKYGDVTRDPSYFKKIVEKYNGVVVEDNMVRSGEYIEGKYKPWSWRVIKIMKNNSEINNDKLLQTNTKLKISYVCLIYKSTRWLKFLYEQFHKHTKLNNDDEFYFVANDAYPEVLDYLNKNSHIKHYIHENTEEQKKEWYINNVYRAWNTAAQKAKGDYIIFLNSDFAFSPGWNINLINKITENTCVCSRLVERGIMRSGKYGIEKNFGNNYNDYRENDFIKYANSIKESKLYEGGLYMPLLIKKEHLEMVGYYSEGNIKKTSTLENPIIAKKGEPVIPGDVFLMEKLRRINVHHVTAFDSIIYHFQEGEMRE